MESAGDTIKAISKILQDFPFEYTEDEIGGFGSIHLYKARKLTNAWTQICFSAAAAKQTGDASVMRQRGSNENTNGLFRKCCIDRLKPKLKAAVRPDANWEAANDEVDVACYVHLRIDADRLPR